MIKPFLGVSLTRSLSFNPSPTLMGTSRLLVLKITLHYTGQVLKIEGKKEWPSSIDFSQMERPLSPARERCWWSIRLNENHSRNYFHSQQFRMNALTLNQKVSQPLPTSRVSRVSLPKRWQHGVIQAYKKNADSHDTTGANKGESGIHDPLGW